MPRANLRGLIQLVLAWCVLVSGASAEEPCSKKVYLTIDTGSMTAAEAIRSTLHTESVKATFFVANEKTAYQNRVLDPEWAEFWKSLVADGHRFGNHTWDHWTAREDLPDGRLRLTTPEGKSEILDEAGYCQELQKVDARFKDMTGEHLSPIWRAPGGHTTPRLLKWAKACGFPQHVGWSSAGFLGDELPSEKFSNEMLLNRALKSIRDGDVLMMHLGIRSRKDPFVKVFPDLIRGLKARGFCFKRIGE